VDAAGLKRVRTLLGFSQDDLAHCLTVSQSMVAQMETGVRPVPVARERQLKRLLGQPVTDEREARE
jgi:predicted transcriptional regulator